MPNASSRCKSIWGIGAVLRRLALLAIAIALVGTQARADEIVTIDDDLITAGVAVLQAEAKLAVEPAAGAAAAALLGPYRQRLNGKRTALIVCGANIDGASYGRHLVRGLEALHRLD